MLPRESTPELRWHNDRRNAMLRTHPEIKRLYGKTSWTLAVNLTALSLQGVMVWIVAALPGAWVLPLAFFVGAIFQGLQAAPPHEYGHRLAVRSRAFNFVLLRLGSLLSLVRWASFFDNVHTGHHGAQGSHAKNEFGESVDCDIPLFSYLNLPAEGPPGPVNAVRRYLRSNARIVGLFVMLYTRYAVWDYRALRSLVRGETMRVVYRDSLIDGALKLAAFSLVFLFFGAKPIAYLLLCDMFAMGFLGHPYLAFWVTQHHTNELLSPKEFVATGGVAGRLYNLLILNQGHHCEHHDFPQIPWTRLPRVARLAPEFYPHVPASRTWYNVLASYYGQTDRAFHYSTHPESPGNGVPGTLGALA